LVLQKSVNKVVSASGVLGVDPLPRVPAPIAATAPTPKLSAQTKILLEVMTNKERDDVDRWDRVMAHLDRLTEKVMSMDDVQQQLLAQAGLAADVARQAMEERVRFAQQLDQAEKALAELRLEQMARNMESAQSVRSERHRGGLHHLCRWFLQVHSAGMQVCHWVVRERLEGGGLRILKVGISQYHGCHFPNSKGRNLVSGLISVWIISLCIGSLSQFG
jgi:hypothetical protein